MSASGLFAKMANSARKIDSVLKQILTTNSYVKMDDKFKETYAKDSLEVNNRLLF